MWWREKEVGERRGEGYRGKILESGNATVSAELGVRKEHSVPLSSSGDSGCDSSRLTRVSSASGQANPAPPLLLSQPQP